jgi:hypothetical protein
MMMDISKKKSVTIKQSLKKGTVLARVFVTLLTLVFFVGPVLVEFLSLLNDLELNWNYA